MKINLLLVMVLVVSMAGCKGAAKKSNIPNQTSSSTPTTSIVPVPPPPPPPPGSPDVTFGTNGMVELSTIPGATIGGGSAFHTCRMDPAGKIVAGGSSTNNGSSSAVVRLLSDGALDTSFNGTGYQVRDDGTNPAGNDRIGGVWVGSNSEIMAAGLGANANGDVFTWKFLNTGALDATWGTNGINSQAVSAAEDVGYAILPLSSGNVLVAGYSAFFGAFVSRLTSTGALDTTFGTNGYYTPGANAARNMVLDTAGNIYAVGGNGSNMRLVKLLPGGTGDNSFGTSGVVYYTGTVYSHGNDLKLDAQGRIVVAGQTRATGTGIDYDFAVWRYNTNGTPDTTFGTGGVVLMDFLNQGLSDSAWELEIDSTGRIIVAGEAGKPDLAATGTQQDAVIVRLNTDGTLDTTLNGTGIIWVDSTPAGGPDVDEVGLCLEIDSNGNYVMGGQRKPQQPVGSPSVFAMWRYLP
ncbi:MAG: hypothetical protein OEW39_07865 [Deltaproteobacteria bacterium]|nr:hypothetical protein [Deltaproteobacteria bacterium]